MKIVIAAIVFNFLLVENFFNSFQLVAHDPEEFSRALIAFRNNPKLFNEFGDAAEVIERHCFQNPQIFLNENILNILVDATRREFTLFFRTKSDPSFCFLCSKLLAILFSDSSKEIPLQVFQVCIDDWCGEQLWYRSCEVVETFVEGLISTLKNPQPMMRFRHELLEEVSTFFQMSISRLGGCSNWHSIRDHNRDSLLRFFLIACRFQKIRHQLFPILQDLINDGRTCKTAVELFLVCCGHSAADPSDEIYLPLLSKTRIPEEFQNHQIQGLCFLLKTSNERLFKKFLCEISSAVEVEKNIYHRVLQKSTPSMCQFPEIVFTTINDLQKQNPKAIYTIIEFLAEAYTSGDWEDGRVSLECIALRLDLLLLNQECSQKEVFSHFASILKSLLSKNGNFFSVAHLFHSFIQLVSLKSDSTVDAVSVFEFVKNNSTLAALSLETIFLILTVHGWNFKDRVLVSIALAENSIRLLVSGSISTLNNYALPSEFWRSFEKEITDATLGIVIRLFVCLVAIFPDLKVEILSSQISTALIDTFEYQDLVPIAVLLCRCRNPDYLRSFLSLSTKPKGMKLDRIGKLIAQEKSVADAIPVDVVVDLLSSEKCNVLYFERRAKLCARSVLEYSLEVAPMKQNVVARVGLVINLIKIFAKGKNWASLLEQEFENGNISESALISYVYWNLLNEVDSTLAGEIFLLIKNCGTSIVSLWDALERSLCENEDLVKKKTRTLKEARFVVSIDIDRYPLIGKYFSEDISQSARIDFVGERFLSNVPTLAVTVSSESKESSTDFVNICKGKERKQKISPIWFSFSSLIYKFWLDCSNDLVVCTLIRTWVDNPKLSDPLISIIQSKVDGYGSLSIADISKLAWYWKFMDIVIIVTKIHLASTLEKSAAALTFLTFFVSTTHQFLMSNLLSKVTSLAELLVGHRLLRLYENFLPDHRQLLEVLLRSDNLQLIGKLAKKFPTLQHFPRIHQLLQDRKQVFIFAKEDSLLKENQRMGISQNIASLSAEKSNTTAFKSALYSLQIILGDLNVFKESFPEFLLEMEADLISLCCIIQNNQAKIGDEFLQKFFSLLIAFLRLAPDNIPFQIIVLKKLVGSCSLPTSLLEQFFVLSKFLRKDIISRLLYRDEKSNLIVESLMRIFL